MRKETQVPTLMSFLAHPVAYVQAERRVALSSVRAVSSTIVGCRTSDCDSLTGALPVATSRDTSRVIGNPLSTSLPALPVHNCSAYKRHWNLEKCVKRTKPFFWRII